MAHTNGNVNDRPKLNYGELVRPGQVHSAVYSDPDVFEDEMENIFHRHWVYVGHTSEIRNSGDYQRRWIGRQSVLMTRDKDGEVHLLLNRCRHRANVLCQDSEGNSDLFRCAYHGWTYKNDGRLVGVPYPSGYSSDFRTEDYGLTKVPRVGIYRGFVWGSLAEAGISLDEYIGRAKQFIDLFCDASPEGEIDLRHGVHKLVYYGNWKLMGGDGYHPEVTHKASQQAMRAKRVGRESDLVLDRNAVYRGQDSMSQGLYSRDLGGGHYRLGGGNMRLRALPDTEENRAYRAALVSRLGEERAAYVINAGGDPHLMMMPNLHVVGPHVRLLRPTKVDETEVYLYVAFLKGAPRAVNLQRLRDQEVTSGPAGGIHPDDVEIFDRLHLGMAGQLDRWQLVSRGLHRERRDVDGSMIADLTDETTQRAQLGWWMDVMSREPNRTESK